MRPNLLSLISISKIPRKKSKKTKKPWILILFAFSLGIILTLLPFILLELVNYQQVKYFVNQVSNFVQNNVSFIFGLVGFFGSLITGKTLKEIKQANQDLREDTSERLKEIKQSNQDTSERLQEIKQANQDLREITSKRLKEITKAHQDLEDEIVKIEDSTRKNYSNFGSIFARSLWLLKQAKEEVYYVNFIHSLGVPHKQNEEVKRSYEKHAQELNEKTSSNDEKITENYEEAVKNHNDILIRKMQEVKKFVSIVLNEKSLKNYFLNTLRTRPGYEEIDQLITEVIDKEKEFLETKLQACKKLRGKDKEEGLEVYPLPKILLQLLITKIKEKRGTSTIDSKWGCLVFFVGTHNIGITEAMKGYYTEDKNQVEIYKELARILLQTSEETKTSGSPVEVIRENHAKTETLSL